MFHPLIARQTEDRSAYDREDAEALQRLRLISRVLAGAQAQHWPALSAGTVRTQHREAAWRFDVQRWSAAELAAVLQALGVA